MIWDFKGSSRGYALLSCDQTKDQLPKPYQAYFSGFAALLWRSVNQSAKVGCGLFVNAENAVDCSPVHEMPQSNNNVLRIYHWICTSQPPFKAPFCRNNFLNCEDLQWVKCGHGSTQLESSGSCSFALSRAHCLEWLTSVPLYDPIRQPLDQHLDFPVDSCWRYLISIYNFM